MANVALKRADTQKAACGVQSQERFQSYLYNVTHRQEQTSASVRRKAVTLGLLFSVNHNERCIRSYAGHRVAALLFVSVLRLA